MITFLVHILDASYSLCREACLIFLKLNVDVIFLHIGLMKNMSPSDLGMHSWLKSIFGTLIFIISPFLFVVAAPSTRMRLFHSFLGH